MAKSTTTADTTTTTKVNKSEAIRSYLKTNPHATPSEIHKVLALQGIDASISLCGVVKYKKKGDKPTKTKTKASNGQINVEQLVAARKFVNAVGGDFQHAKDALNSLERIR